MKKKAIMLASLLVTLGIGLYTSITPVSSAKLVIGVDLAHGESEARGRGLSFVSIETIAANITFAEWRKITETITPATLEELDVLMIGQPTVAFTPSELNAIKSWLNEGGKALWVAGDSDFGSGPSFQDIANSILEFVGSSLRIDLVSVEDPESNAGRSYRVVAIVKPDPGLELLTEGFENEGRVLFHGPGVLAYVKPDGTWESLAKSKPENVFRIVWTTEASVIVENNPPPGLAHTAGEKGSFVTLAAEIFTVNGKKNIIIASSESPYGDYQPIFTPVYYDVWMDGPVFIKNMVSWLTSELTTLEVTITSIVTTTIVNTVTETVTTTKEVEVVPSSAIIVAAIIIAVAAIGAASLVRRRK